MESVNPKDEILKEFEEVLAPHLEKPKMIIVFKELLSKYLSQALTTQEQEVRARVLEEVEKELMKKVFVKCECKNGNCPNCYRLVLTLDSLKTKA